MARYYRTASARPIDYMYRMNTPLMEKVLMQNDAGITNQFNQLGQIGAAGSNIPFFGDVDEKRAKALSESYNQQVDSIVKATRKDPASWKKQLEPMRELSKRLQKDFTTGEVSKLSANQSRIKGTFDYIDKQTEQFNKDGKGISPEENRAFKEYFAKNFKGTNYNPTTSSYDTANVFNPSNTIDIKKFLGERLDKIKADKNSFTKEEVTKDGMYFNAIKNTWEGIKPEKILGIINDEITNPQLQNFFQERIAAGLISGVYNKDGSMIRPYDITGVPVSVEESKYVDKLRDEANKTKDKDKRKKLTDAIDDYVNTLTKRTALEWNPNSYLSSPIRGLTSEYSWEKIETENKLRNNSAWNTIYSQNQANYRQNRQLNQEVELLKIREAGANERLMKGQELDREKLYYQRDKDAGSKSVGGVTLPYTQTTASRIATNSFEDWNTLSRNRVEVPVLSRAGLTGDIENYKKEIDVINNEKSDIDRQINTLLNNREPSELSPWERGSYNLLNVKKEQINKNIADKESSLNKRREWYKRSEDAALSNHPLSVDDTDTDTKNLTADEIRIYKDFENDRDGKKLLKRVEANMSIVYDTPEQYERAVLAGIQKINTEVPATRERLEKYIKAKTRIDKKMGTFLENMKTTPIESDAINPGTEDQKELANIIFSNTQGLRVLNEKGEPSGRLPSLDGSGAFHVADPRSVYGLRNLLTLGTKVDNYSFTFDESGKDGYKGNLQDYMIDHGVVPIIEQIGTSTRAGGGGALAKVSFKDPNGEIKANESFYIELTPELQKIVSDRFKKSTDPSVRSIASDIGDTNISAIRKQFVQPKSPYAGNFTVNVESPGGRIPFNVSESLTSDGKKILYITAEGKNGEVVPVDFKIGTVPGVFRSGEDFISQYKQSLIRQRPK